MAVNWKYIENIKHSSNLLVLYKKNKYFGRIFPLTLDKKKDIETVVRKSVVVLVQRLAGWEVCWVFGDFREQTAHSGHAMGTISLPKALWRCCLRFVLIPLVLRAPGSSFRRVWWLWSGGIKAGDFPLLAAAPGSHWGHPTALHNLGTLWKG